MGEEKYLSSLAELGQDLEAGQSSWVVEAHQNVIDDEGDGLASMHLLLEGGQARR